MKIVYHAGNIAEAHIVGGLLESNGIAVHIGGHYLQGGIGELPAMDTATIQVEEQDLDHARELIQAYEANTAPEKNERNKNISTPSPRMSVFNSFMAGIVIALVIGWLIISLTRG